VWPWGGPHPPEERRGQGWGFAMRAVSMPAGGEEGPVFRAGAAIVAVGGLRGAVGVLVLDEGKAGEGGRTDDVPQRSVLIGGVDGHQLGVVPDRPPPPDDVRSDSLRLRRLCRQPSPSLR
jgi:hypothetical protein